MDCLHEYDIRRIDFGSYWKYEKFCIHCGLVIGSWIMPKIKPGADPKENNKGEM